MRNRILGILIILCTLLVLFTGTCMFLGTFVLNKGPTLINIVSTHPSGAQYNAANLINELAVDLVPVLWVPEVAAGLISDDVTFGLSTFSKIPRILKVLDGTYSTNIRSVTIDLTELDFLREYFGTVSQGTYPHLEVYVEGSAQTYSIQFGQMKTFFVDSGVKVRYWISGSNWMSSTQYDKYRWANYYVAVNGTTYYYRGGSGSNPVKKNPWIPAIMYSYTEINEDTILSFTAQVYESSAS